MNRRGPTNGIILTMATLSCSQLLDTVARRQRMAGMGRHLFGWLVTVAAVYVVVLLVERLLGLTVWPLPWWTLGAVPLLGLAGAMITYRSPNQYATARLIDRRCDTKDLFLTAAMLERSPGQFQPLVARDAESAAGTVAPARVVPFEWVDRAGIVLLAIVLLAAGWLWMPPLDPFGAVAARAEDDQKKQKLADTRRATKARMAQLKKAPQRDEAKLTQQAVEDLKLTFRKMQPNQRAGNLQKLTARQRELGERWRKSAAKNLANALNQQAAAQSLGGREGPKQQKWQQELQAGQTGGLSQEMQKIQELARQAAEATDPVTAQQLKQEVAERLKDLSEFAQRQFKDQPLDTALRRALEQFELARLEGLNLEALAGLCESMDLSQMELVQLAESLGELMTLEETLVALQRAKMLNDLEPLDGEACGSCEGIGDYAELYAQLLAQYAGAGPGPGMGGPGQGEGNIAPEDESLDSDFQTTRARSPLTPGKILMSMKVKGLSDKGRVDRQYANSLARVKQDVSDAVVAERVPPGYHNAIKRYFDTLGEPADATRSK